MRSACGRGWPEEGLLTLFTVSKYVAMASEACSACERLCRKERVRPARVWVRVFGRAAPWTGPCLCLFSLTTYDWAGSRPLQKI